MDDLIQLTQALLVGSIGWLDAMPDAARAGLAGFLLAVVLAFFEGRIPAREIHYGQSFRKASLIALLLIPAFVGLVPASRMVVFVEELPAQATATSWLWFGVGAVWLSGALIFTAAMIRRRILEQRLLRGLPIVEDDRLTNRLAHWRARLGMSGPAVLTASPDDTPRFLTSGSRLLFPAAGMRWPVNQQDVLIITGLCSLKCHHARWHHLAEFVSCVYWPVTWVQRLHANLLRDFRQAASDLARSCYQDRLGYGRTLRQLEQRLSTPGHRPGRKPPTSPAGPAGRLAAIGRTYWTSLQTGLRSAEPGWPVGELLSAHSEAERSLWTDPYDRVVLFIGQAVFLSFLLTGATLKVQPPDLDDRFEMPFGLLWKEHFHRNLEFREKAQPES